MSRSEKAVYGIPCNLRSEKVREAILQVLEQVQDRYPKDFVRLQSRIKGILPLTKQEAEEGTLGRWEEVSSRVTRDDPTTWALDLVDVPGFLYLLDRASRDRSSLVGVIAHELGHACTTEDDLFGCLQPPEHYSYRCGC